MRIAVIIAVLALALTPALAEAKVKNAPLPEPAAVETDAPAIETEMPAPESQPPAPDDLVPAAPPELASGDPVSVQAFNTCLSYARGDAEPGETAKSLGWDAYEDQGESPFVKSYSGNKTFTAVGDATLFSLVESYPDTTFGYCRVDIQPSVSDAGVQSPLGDANLNALRDLPELAGGQVITNSVGTFGSWKGAEAEPQLLLLSQQTPDAYVLQMTIITHRAGPAVAK